ncbi:MAG: hypothetical protein PHR97_02510 [Bacteroidales bacterium]|nr:hypothetical protein [Bacteroidales bacterium]
MRMPRPQASAAPSTPVDTAIALKTDYAAKNGAPTSTTPKIFLKYF